MRNCPRSPMPAGRWPTAPPRSGTIRPPGNLCYDWELGDRAATEAAFANAHRVVELELINNRLIPNAMEPRAAIGDYDPASGQYTLYTTSQNPHVIRLLMGAYVLQIPEHKLRVVAPDVGGGFGSKIYHYAEEAIVTWAAKKLERPVRWTAERTESFMTDAHGRDHWSRARLAFDARTTRCWRLRGRRPTPISAPIMSTVLVPRCRPICTPRCSSGLSTTSPAIYTEVKSASTPTPRRSTPIAAPAAPRPAICWNGWSTRPRRGSGKVDPDRTAASKNFITADMIPASDSGDHVQYDIGDFNANARRRT